MTFALRVPGLDDMCLAQFLSSTDTRWSNFIKYVRLWSLLAPVAVADVRSLTLDDFCSSNKVTLCLGQFSSSSSDTRWPSFIE